MPAKKATKRKSKKAPSPAQLRARKAFAAAAKARSKAAKGKKRASKKPSVKRARNKTIITKPRKVVVLNGRKKATKRRNAEHRDAAHPIHVSQYWQGRKGYLTPWQRAHKAGQQGLFEHGIKARNPKKNPLHDTYGWGTHKTDAGYKWTVHGYTHGVGQETLKSGLQPTREKATAQAKKWVLYFRKVKAQSAKKNPATKKASPAVRKIRKSFTGLTANKTTAMHVPQGTPVNLAKLGRLVSIKTEKGVINPAKGVGLVLCSDAKGRLHIASTKKPGVKNPAHKQTFGEVKEIEYETAKPHLGYKKSTIFFHRMGEEGGRKPTLFSDGQYLRLRGGSYKITPRGIVN